MFADVEPLPPSQPRVTVWRDPQGNYVVMHLAQVTPGHLVGWGSLRRMSPLEATSEAYGYVVGSLGEFPSRDGGSKDRRLKLQPGEYASLGPDRLHITLASPGTLALARQHPPDANTVHVPLSASPAEFFASLEAAFALDGPAAT